MQYRLLFLLLFLSSCAANRMVETDLYFGMLKRDGGSVTEAEWKNFKANQVSRLLKEGSTTVEAQGSWRDPENGKLINEPTRIVIYIHKKSKLTSMQIDSLRHLYKMVFMQQSVLRVDRKVTVSF